MGRLLAHSVCLYTVFPYSNGIAQLLNKKKQQCKSYDKIIYFCWTDKLLWLDLFNIISFTLYYISSLYAIIL